MLSSQFRRKSASIFTNVMKPRVQPTWMTAFKNFNTRHAAFRSTLALNKPVSSQADNFVNGTSAVYVDMLYDQWKENPESVHPSWQAYFNNVEHDVAIPYTPPPSLGRVESQSTSIDHII